jgi:hypothetical protein
MASIDSLSKQVMAILDAMPNLDGYDSEVPETPARAYTVFYPGAGHGFGDRLADLGSKLYWDFRLVCCGMSPGQCRRATDQTRAAFLGVRLDTGRATIPLREDRAFNAPMLRDDSVPSDVRWSQTLHYYTSARRS